MLLVEIVSMNCLRSSIRREFLTKVRHFLLFMLGTLSIKAVECCFFAIDPGSTYLNTIT